MASVAQAVARAAARRRDGGEEPSELEARRRALLAEVRHYHSVYMAVVRVVNVHCWQGCSAQLQTQAEKTC